MATTRERQRDRAQEHTEIYRKHMDEFSRKMGGQRADRRITTKEEVEAALTYWDRRGQRLAYVVTPQAGYNVRNLFTFIAEMDAHSKSQVHRHRNEAVIHILKGSGYTLFDIDKEKVEWKAGDTICIPQWTWHQHVVTSEEPARFLATINQPLMEALGLWEIEDYLGDRQ